MKVRRTVLVSLVAALLVLGVPAAGAAAASSGRCVGPVRSGPIKWTGCITYSQGGNVTGSLLVENLKRYKVRVSCGVSVFVGPQLVGVDVLQGVLPGHGFMVSHWYVEGPVSSGRPHGYYHCTGVRA